ncbi:hypothetical protein [Variovorax rhizosphaerae]|uniref:Uncharacterized protein n=1 Tax=Variovorax rhizosphaerae TaxID=1836200 RepID=A0ABU8WV64_9BURK
MRSRSDASAYLGLARRVMGAGWVQPANVRFGAPGLLQDLPPEDRLGT